MASIKIINNTYIFPKNFQGRAQKKLLDFLRSVIRYANVIQMQTELCRCK